MTIAEKIAYIKGLRDGVGLDTAKPEARLIDAMLDVLQDISVAISDLDDQALAVSDELDEMEDTLDMLEEIVFDEYEDDYDDDDDDEDEEDEDEDEDEEDDDAVFDFGDEVIYELSCPVCGEPITIDEEILEKGSINCPKCGEELEFDLSEDEEEE